MRESRSATWGTRVLVLLVVLPVLASLVMTIAPSGISEWSYWWRDMRGWRIFVSSVAFAAFGAAVALVFGALVAFSLPRNRFASRLILTLGCLPVLVPSSLMGVGWIMAMGTDAVVTNQLRRVFGAHTPTIYNWSMAAGATGLRYFGIAALLLANVRIATQSSRAAERVFALPRRERLRLKLSALTVPLVGTAALLLILVFSDHILPGLFLIHTFGTEVLVQYNALMNPTGAAVLALLPAVLSIGIALLILRVIGRRSWSLARDDAEMSAAGIWPLSIIAIAVAVGIPVAGLVVRAASASNLISSLIEAKAEAVHSAWLAAVGAILTVVVTLPVVISAIASHQSRRLSISWIVLINLVVPGSLIALGMISLLSPRMLQWMQDSEIPLVLGYAARFVPVILLLLFIAWLRLSPMASASARLHCPSRAARVFAIALPPRAPSLVISFALAALLITAELDISLILVRPGRTTLGVRLYSMIHLAPDAVVSALAVDMLLLVMAFVIACLILRMLATRALHGSAR